MKARQYNVGDEPIEGYVLKRVLGKGSAGVVWLATGPGEVDVALKIVTKLREHSGARDLHGLNLVKNIRDAHLCQVHWFKLKDGDGREIRSSSPHRENDQLMETVQLDEEPVDAAELIIAMDLGDETLSRVFERHPNGIPVEQLYRYIEATGRAVHYLNQKHSICHCDLKPDNIILVNGEAKVCDYGLARVVVSDEGEGTERLAATPQYGAPEMMMSRQYHPKMDQYSLALVYAYLRTGTFPFPSFSQVSSQSRLVALGKEKMNGKYDLSPLPPAEREVVGRALSPDPQDRYESIAEWLEALRAAVFLPQPKKRPFTGMAAVAMTLALLAGLAYLGPESLQRNVTKILPFPLAQEDVDAPTPEPPTPELKPPTPEPKPPTPGPKPPTPEPKPPTPEPKPQSLAMARDHLNRYDRTKNTEDLTEALAILKGLISEDEVSEDLDQLEQDCLDRYLPLIQERLERGDREAARPLLRNIADYRRKYPQRWSREFARKYAGPFARQAAFDQHWEEVEQYLDEFLPESETFAAPERAWLLVLKLHAVLQQRPELLVQPAQLELLRQLRIVREELDTPERELAKHLENQTLERISDPLNAPEKELINELWPNLLFDRLFARIHDTIRSGGDVDPGSLEELKELATTPREEGDLAFLQFLVAQRDPISADAFRQAVADLKRLLREHRETGSLLDPQELFEALVARRQPDRGVVLAEAASMPELWDLWSSRVADKRDVCGVLDCRLRVLALGAAVFADPPDDAVLERLAGPVVARWGDSRQETEDLDGEQQEDGGKPLIAAAWIESRLEREEAPHLDSQDDPAWQAALAMLREARPASGHADYVRYVQALERSQVQQSPRQAAEMLMALPEDSAVMGAARRRYLAGQILLAGVQSIRKPETGFSIRTFGEDTDWVCRALLLARKYWGDKLATPEEKLDLAENLVLASTEAGREPAQWLSNAERILELRSGARLLGARLECARRWYGENPDEAAAQAAILRAYADLLVWIEEPARSRELAEFREEYLDAAWHHARELPLISAVRDLKLEELWEQLPLPDPESPLGGRIAGVAEPRSLAVICVQQGRRLQREFALDSAGILSRLQVFAVASWLAPDDADSIVELAETLRHIPDQDAAKVLFMMESLAERAGRADADFHGVWGLQAYVELMRARRATDQRARLQHLENAIKFYQEAWEAAPPRGFRARYLVGCSTAYLESAFSLPQGGGEVIGEQERRFNEARKLAEQATRITDSIDPREMAWLAKGHAEEDLAHYIGHYELFRDARGSFTTAMNLAPEGGRAAVPGLARGRSRFRELQHAARAGRRNRDQIDRLLEDEVLPDLATAAQVGPQARLRAEAHFWKSQVYLFRVSSLANQPGRNRNRDLESADSYCGQAAQIARDAALVDWPVYQRQWLTIGWHRSIYDDIDITKIKKRAEGFLDVAREPPAEMTIRPSDEFDVMMFYFPLINAIEARRDRIDARLDHFPAGAPERIAFRSLLLAQRGRWTLREVEPNLPLFRDAKQDADAALDLAQQIPDDHDERERALGLAHGVRGLWLARQFWAHGRVDEQGFEWADTAGRELRAAFEHYRSYRERSGRWDRVTEEYTEICDILGIIARDLFQDFRKSQGFRQRYNPAEWEALAEEGVAALETIDLERVAQVDRKRIQQTLQTLREQLR